MKVVVCGAGAAGLMAASRAAQNGNEVLLIEKNERPARKVMITGKGRCNVTNNCDSKTLLDNVLTNPRFLYSAFRKFDSADTCDFFESAGVPLKTERGNRVFPVSDKAVDIVDALVKTAKKNRVKFLNAAVKKIIAENAQVKAVLLENGEKIECEKCIIATGGASYTATGSTGDGYRFSKELGHSIVPVRPSLVPVKIKEAFASKMMGLSLKNVRLDVFYGEEKKPVFSQMGEMLFTHFGVSGPLVLSASAKMNKEDKTKYTFIIDLKPALSENQLDSRILRDFKNESNKIFRNSLNELLPKKMIPTVISLSKIDPDLKVNQITKEQRLCLVKIIKSLKMSVVGFRPLEEAIVTSGGVSVKEINPATMESKIVKGLYFAGEVIDVDAYTGGFNLQIAFSTGFLAGDSI